MKKLKLNLLVLALVIFAASSAFASTSYDVTIDTSYLNGSGYLYLQYDSINAAASTATVSSFTMDGGSLGAQDTTPGDIVNGSAVTGTLPGKVTFANTNMVNDYNQALTFGNSFSFLLTLSDPAAGGAQGGASTFSLGLFGDALGNVPLVNKSGINGTVAGTVLLVNLPNLGNSGYNTPGNNVSPVPLPSPALLLGTALIGLVGIRKMAMN